MPRRRVAEDAVSRLVAEVGGLTQADISRATGLAPSTVSDIVRKLEAKGVVYRVKRGKQVYVYPSLSPIRGGGRRLRLGMIRAGEYVFVAPLAKILKRDHGITVEVAVYDNGLQVLQDLVEGKLDVALAPLVTELLFYMLTRRLRIVGGGAGGGASLLLSHAGQRQGVAVTTASSMELCLYMLSKDASWSEIKYKERGEDIVRALLKGEVGAAVLWEPYATRAVLRGVKRAEQCLDAGLTHCCALAVSSGLSDEDIELVKRAYLEAFDRFRTDVSTWCQWYAALTGLSADEVKLAIPFYRYDPIIEVSEVLAMLRKAGLKLPSYPVLSEAIARS